MPDEFDFSPIDNVDFTGGFGDFNPGDIDWSSLGIDPSTFATWGMGDRGLGTTDPTASDGTGTLSPDEIAALGLTGGVGFQSGGGSAGGASSALASLAKSLGLVGKNGSPDLLGLASILGPLLGGIMAKSATSKASDQMQNAAKDANTMVQGMYGPAQAAFQPFMNAGQGALTKLQGMNYQPLAPQFQPLGAGRAMTTLGALGKGR